jgi:hypothetical protein
MTQPGSHTAKSLISTKGVGLTFFKTLGAANDYRMQLFNPGALNDAKDWRLSLGLSRQGAEFSRPWSESRPMYLGLRWRGLADLRSRSACVV